MHKLVWISFGMDYVDLTMGSCVSSSDSSCDGAPREKVSGNPEDNSPPSKKSSNIVTRYASWGKRKGAAALKSISKRNHVRDHKSPEEGSQEAVSVKNEGENVNKPSEPKVTTAQVEVSHPSESISVKEPLAPVPDHEGEKPVADQNYGPGSDSGILKGRELEETVSVFGTGSSIKVTDTYAENESNDAAGPSVLERHNVVVIGDGPELLFMSHGFGTNQQIWGGVLKHFDLQNTYKIIMWDLMGAYSTNPEGFDFQRYSTLHGYADDLLEVLDELGVESCTYVGHSVSGMIGVIASVERPTVFKRLILIGASARYLDCPGYKGGFTLEQLDQVFAAMQDNYKVWASGFAPLVIGEDVESPHVREFCRSLFLVRPDIAFSTLRTIFTCDLRHLLSQVSVQVHLLQTARDAAVPWDAVQYMLDAFPIACVEMVPVAGHLPHLTHPETIADAILRHLSMPPRQLKPMNDYATDVEVDDAF